MKSRWRWMSAEKANNLYVVNPHTGQLLSIGPKRAARRERKDKRAAKTSFPVPLVLSGRDGRRTAAAKHEKYPGKWKASKRAA